MRFSQATAKAEGADGPVWARSRRRRVSAGPFVGLVGAILAVIGGLTVVLAVKERSVAQAGAIMDGWIDSGWTVARNLTGRATGSADRSA